MRWGFPVRTRGIFSGCARRPALGAGVQASSLVRRNGTSIALYQGDDARLAEWAYICYNIIKFSNTDESVQTIIRLPGVVLRRAGDGKTGKEDTQENIAHNLYEIANNTHTTSHNTLLSSLREPFFHDLSIQPCRRLCTDIKIMN